MQKGPSKHLGPSNQVPGQKRKGIREMPAKFRRDGLVDGEARGLGSESGSRRTCRWLGLGLGWPVVAARREHVARDGAVSWRWRTGEVGREGPGLRPSLG